jgi:hypothetical protein
MRTRRDLAFIFLFPVLPSFNSSCNLFSIAVIFDLIQRVVKSVFRRRNNAGTLASRSGWNGLRWGLGGGFGAARVSAHPCLPDYDMNIIGTVV